MAMKEMSKQDMISRGYVDHTKQEKDIMAKVQRITPYFLIFYSFSFLF